MKKIILSVLFTGVFYAILWWKIAPGMEYSESYRILILLGGRLPDGIIQAITLFLFVFGIMDIRGLNSRLKIEKKAYYLNHGIPDMVVHREDASKIKEASAQHGYYLLSALIKNCCTKFILTSDSSEALALNDSLIDNYQSKFESDQTFIRYVAWAIPSVGFIGTVWGIGQSLTLAKEAATEAGIEKITAALGVAFDTTLFALLLSIILMFLIHTYQKKQDNFFAEMKDFVIEKLINRFQA
ncbi:MAG: MotA/TolQ/ExbB proton channel family protein [Marinilabiliaceae bacterium]|nr:MotA/TolQ/ExbB proton channel family protein [Marinilabiliaceae bacterium]